MASFTDHYNAISIDRFPSKTKIGKGSQWFNNSLYVRANSPPLQSRFKENAEILAKNSTTQENITISRKNFHFFIKNTKKNHSSASDWWENTKSSFKENSKNSTIQENIRILRLKEDCKPYTKKKNSNQKLNHWLKTCKMNFLN